MGLFQSRRDPIDSRQRSVEAKLAAIKKQIADEKSRPAEIPGPGSRPPTTRPKTALGYVAKPAATPPNIPARKVKHDPVFEPLDPKRLHPGPDARTTPAHFNELGVRKYDLPALWLRICSLFKTSEPSNPQLVNYLAAGSMHGLRAMRYEKRIARRRFVIFFLLLLVVLTGIAAALLRKF